MNLQGFAHLKSLLFLLFLLLIEVIVFCVTPDIFM